MILFLSLLSGLSSLTSDPRLAIRKSALEVLFNILKDHGHLFSRSFWITVINTVVFPIFKSVNEKKENQQNKTWDSETCSVATRCLIDLFINFFPIMRGAHLSSVISLLAGFLKTPGQGSASTGVTGLMRLVGELGGLLTEDEWASIFLALKDTSGSMLPGFFKLVRVMDRIEMPPNVGQIYDDAEMLNGNGDGNGSNSIQDYEDDNLQTAGYVVSRMKTHISTQLLIMQVVITYYLLL